MTESEWQERVRRHLNRPDSGIRVWRQNAGKWRALRPWPSMKAHLLMVGRAFLSFDRKRIERALSFVSDWVTGAPKGAADLVGLISGTHLEVECKVKEPWSKPQQRWAQNINERGGVYILATWVDGRSIEENLAMVEDRVREAWRHAA